MKEYKLFINNEWIDAEDGATFVTYDKATGEPLARFAKAARVDVDKAIAAAKAAFDSGVWSDIPPQERAACMHRAARILERRFDEFALTECREVGKPISEITGYDVPVVIKALDYYASMNVALRGESAYIPGNQFANSVTYEPFGVVGTISPWNYPMHLFTRSICPAIAAGNCVVSKASSLTPSTASMLCEVFLEAGFPAGVINVVTGPGAPVSEAYFASDDIEVVAFTGSEEVGRTLLQKASQARIIKKVVLELGGKGPFIMHKDCDVSAAVSSLIGGFCSNQGQVCCASSRAYIHADVYDRAIKLLTERCNALRLGDPKLADTQMGTVISAEQAEKIDGFVQRAVAGGAKLLCGGHAVAVPGFEKAHFYAPTVLAPASHDMECVQEEIFGPVLVVFKYQDIDEAIRLCNDTRFGLGATVWSESPRILHKTARALKAGTVWQNCNICCQMEAPYGGVRNSGIGRENGAQGMLEYLRVKDVMLYIDDYADSDQDC